MIITNSTPDEFYFKQLLVFITSMKINSPEHKVRVFLANYPDDLCEKLQTSFANCVFENWDLDMIDKRGFALILFRVAMLKECMEKYDEHVAWIDTDVVVRKDLSEFLEIESNQLKILYRGDNKPDKVKINAGIFNIGSSEITYGFVCDWYERIKVNAKWGMGQLEMWKAYQDHKDKIELIKMDEKFNDLGGSDRPNAFSKYSAMWHCKKCHFNNDKFQGEFQEYLKKGKEILYG